ncbi:MAG TPA: DUF1893 domain-containing protein [Caldithrix abyssi]|uniref:DUF1893 domain-containing protein n=1 Tax=Caldithrix abyssi TaxID=187145 RepID=A0A7V5H2B4_CALAY|nr:DUF1893 domain-containing protein [Caldithrix abyssi]
MKHSLEVYLNEELIFFSDRHWLHPLFELEAFLNKGDFPVEKLWVKDKIIGRAAALILMHLGIKKVHGQTMSRLAREVLDYYNVAFSYDQLIERIACRTEELLKNEWQGIKAYQLVKGRIKAQP